ncbi:MAG: hypothetical protein RLZZ369_2299, partial [Pseudomonadota bacterium]
RLIELSIIVSPLLSLYFAFLIFAIIETAIDSRDFDSQKIIMNLLVSSEMLSRSVVSSVLGSKN